MNQRLRLTLIVAVFFALPALLTLTLISGDQKREALRGDQPGGPIRGRLLAPDGKGVAGIEIDLLLDPTDSSKSGEPQAVRAQSGPEGRFELVAPPLEGRYTIVAGGGIWQHSAEAFSFVGRKPGEELALTLVPGCELEVSFTRADGRPAGTGSFDLEGRVRGGWFEFIGRPPLHRQGRVEQGLMMIDGLPPMQAQLSVRFDTGESLQLKLELEPGRTVKALKL